MSLTDWELWPIAAKVIEAEGHDGGDSCSTGCAVWQKPGTKMVSEHGWLSPIASSSSSLASRTIRTERIKADTDGTIQICR